jgi:TonB family protein
MLSEPTSQLERRIDAMRARSHTIRKRSLIASLAMAGVAFAVACAMQSPDSVVGPKQAAAPKPTRMTADQVYFEFQVEKPVGLALTSATARYPDMLRSANVEGEVLAQFVVDTTGRADMSSFKVLKTTHDLFTNAVKSALPNMKFYPAEVGGKKVKQLVQMPFQFNLTK